MLSPSPVPPYLRLTLLSACLNGWNKSGSLDAGMPMPESFTAKSTTSCSPPVSPSWISRQTSPRSVNLTALLRRLSRTCRRRFGSPRTMTGSCPGNNKLQCNALALPSWLAIAILSSANARRSKATSSSSILPPLIFE